MATEGVSLVFSEDAITAIARFAYEVNSAVENVGAQRLQTIIERVLDDISFTAPDHWARPSRSMPPTCASA
jgi:ATP-dependent HslUV protease ATP-binding subunit HslU